VERVVGPKGKHQRVRVHSRWGSTSTELEFDARRISVQCPCLPDGGGDVELPTARYLEEYDSPPDTVLNQILLGVSTRGYDAPGGG